MIKMSTEYASYNCGNMVHKFLPVSRKLTDYEEVHLGFRCVRGHLFVFVERHRSGPSGAGFVWFSICCSATQDYTGRIKA